MAEIETGTWVTVRVANPITHELAGIAFAGKVARAKTDGTEITGYEVEHGDPGMDDPMVMPAWIVVPMKSFIEECNDVECDNKTPHWIVFDQEHGVGISEHASEAEAIAAAIALEATE